MSILVFNLVPAYPLDGGALVHALIWKRTGNHLRATRIAGRGGQAFAVACVACGVLLTALGAPISGISLAIVGWMLGQAARVAVGWSIGLVEARESSRWWVRPDRPLHALLVDGHLLAHGSLLVVDDGGVLRGVVTTHRLNLLLQAPAAEPAT